MPLDAICLGAVAHEIRTALAGGKIDKIHQPGRDEVVLAVRGTEGSHKLLLSANPSHPRAQLTDITRENPDKPPMFCMLLRKHLSGARVLAVTQPSMERVLILELEALDSLGDRVERKLVLEAMGRHSNLILLDAEGRIVDCLRRVDSDMSARRQVLPGLFYHLPPKQDKQDPTTLDRETLEGLLAAAPEESQADKWLLDTFGGISPLISREMVYRAAGATDARLHLMGEQGRRKLLDELEKLLKTVKENSYTPTVIYRDSKPADYTFMDIGQYEGQGECRTCESFGQMLDEFYAQRESAERVRSQGQDMLRTLTNTRDRIQRKIALQEQELTATLDRELLRQKGDIITSNLYAMTKGMARLRAVNYYDPEGAEIDIELDVLLTPQQNAAKYYKEYNKAKTAQQMLTQQLEKARRELDYLNSVLDSVWRAEGERDLQEIRQELVSSGYLRRPSKAARREKKIDSRPMEFVSSTGLAISVGRNNTQNDLLTCKLATKGDIWLHTQKIHGSHVILWTRGRQPDLTSLNEAACLAAWFSQGREGGKVPVDYTPVRYVKKPAGALPGMVVYTTYETAWVTPDETLVKKLRVK
ncbi:MAG: NFACT family protein [Oscillospiraceae bacterium]|nr:NFACT family protein [Oscillospiraceae bacterium]